MTVIGIDLEARRALLDDGTECAITDLIGSRAVIQLPDGNWTTFDIEGPKMTKQ